MDVEHLRRSLTARPELSLFTGVDVVESTGSTNADLIARAADPEVDGAVLLAQDIATGVQLDRGRCIYPDVPGNGVTLVEAGRDPLA